MKHPGGPPSVRPARQPRPLVRLLVLGVAAAASTPIGADAIYKSVDADGRVTYSSIPPAQGSARQVEEVRIRSAPDGPPTQEAGTPQPPAAEPTPDPKQRADAVKQAQQDLIRAKAELEQAKIQGTGDWRTGANGSRISTARYTERVAAAQAKVAEAEEALERARAP